MSEATQEVEELSQRVVAILRDRGIEATPDQVAKWASDMSDRCFERGFTVSDKCWLEGAAKDSMLATMCLHLFFGDAK